MEAAMRKEMQIRTRIESIFNKREQDFETREEYDNFLEEREDIIFNLVEGIDVKANEARVDEYRRLNADSIVRNEALRAEELRRRVAAAEEGAGAAGLSGTAAAFQEGADAEPHQGMEYTAALPEAAAAAALGAAPAPLPTGAAGAAGADGNLQAAAGQPTGDAWLAMALASGWRQDMPKRKALEQAFGSVLVF